MDVSSDIRIYNQSYNKWEKVEYERANEKYNVFEMEPRYMHSLHLFKNYLIVYGGGGEYMEKLKCRKSFSDLRILDLGTKKWLENDFSRDGGMGGIKRMNHASDIFGCIMVVHGGFCGEEKRTLDDFALFDFYLKKWIKSRVRRGKKQKSNEESSRQPGLPSKI